MKFLSKVLIIFFFLLSTFYLLPSAAYANTAPQVNNYPAPNTNPDVQNNLHNWTQTVMIEVMSSLTCQIAGVDPINPKQSCLGADQKSGKIGFLPSPQTGGAIGFMGNMISVLYTPPLHTADYFQNLAQNFGISKHAYAAPSTGGGTGFQSLSPLINIWSAFRNIVYLILVIVFVVIGLAIMLRVKIDPRTVMTIQNQIPKIIVGILAVTFSFAIAGFLIDMMWVFIYLIYGIISGANLPNVDITNLNPTLMQSKDAISAAGGIAHISGIASNVSFGLGGAIKDALGVEGCSSIATCMNSLFNPLNFIVRPFTPSAIGFSPIELIYDLISWIAGGATYWKILHTPIPEGATPIWSDIWSAITTVTKHLGAVSAAAGVSSATQYLLREGLPWIISYLIIFVALLTALFRLWFTLLMSYVQILLAVTLAPFWIIGGIIPGSQISIGGWFRNISANLLAFPATLGMFMLGKVFMDAFGSQPPTAQFFVPPLIGKPTDPSLIGSLIGLGILLIAPNVVNMLKAALKAPKVDTGIGKALAPGLAVPIRTGEGIQGLAFGNAIERGFLDPGGSGGTGPRSALGRAFRIFGFGGKPG